MSQILVCDGLVSLMYNFVVTFLCVLIGLVTVEHMMPFMKMLFSFPPWGVSASA